MVLLIRRMSNSLSPVEVPVRVRVLVPPVVKPMAPVLLKMSVALLAAPAAVTGSLRKVPEESRAPRPARLKRRSIDIVGVCVDWKMLVVEPVYCSVPVEPAEPSTRLEAALEDAPMLLAIPPLARLVTWRVP